MTNLNIPGLAQTEDIGAYMGAVGVAARAAARALARADSAAEDAHCGRWRRPCARTPPHCWRPMPRMWSPRAPLVTTPRSWIASRSRPASIEAMAVGLEAIVALPDPVGAITDLAFRPTGIQVGHMRVPLGVVGIIYESRPNVTADAAGLCLKSGNATILRGGSEAIRSNRAIAECVTAACVPPDCRSMRCRWSPRRTARRSAT